MVRFNRCKVELSAYGTVTDITDCCKGWEDYEVVLERKSTSGLIRTTSLPFSFVREARQLVHDLFDTYSYLAKADILVSLISPNSKIAGIDTYNLDFSTYEEYDDYVEISGNSNSLSALIEANKTVNIEVDVDSVTSIKNIAYDRVVLSNCISLAQSFNLAIRKASNDPYDNALFCLADRHSEGNTTVLSGITRPSFTVGSALDVEVVSIKDTLLNSSVPEGLRVGSERESTIKKHIYEYSKGFSLFRGYATKEEYSTLTPKYSKPITVRLEGYYEITNFEVVALWKDSITDRINPNNDLRLHIEPHLWIKRGKTGLVETIAKGSVGGLPYTSPLFSSVYSYPGVIYRKARYDFGSGITNEYAAMVYRRYKNLGGNLLDLGSIKMTVNANVVINNDDAIFMTVDIYDHTSPMARFVEACGIVMIESTGWLTATYDFASDPINIPCINPKVVFSRLISKIYDGYFNIIWDISTLEINSLRFILEFVLQGVNKATFTTTLAKYIDWLNILGYELIIKGNIITVVSRDALFNVGKPVFTIEQSRDLKRSSCTDFLFNELKIGYEAKDYGNYNGLNEYNGTITYTVPDSIIKNTLSLLSPYRADPYSIEKLVLDKEQDEVQVVSDKCPQPVNDKESANNGIYFVHVVEDGDKYTLSRQGLKGSLLDKRLFNAMYNPVELLHKNIRLIGICTDFLKYQSASANANVSINNRYLDADVSIPNRYFKPVLLDFACGAFDSFREEEITDNIIEISNKGKTYRGFVKNISKCPLYEKETQYQIYEI